jgi:L-asparaginase
MTTESAIRIFTCGGTIDKVYFDAKDTFTVGNQQISAILEDGNVSFPYSVTQLMQKDSLTITEKDRQIIRQAVEAAKESKIIITHGTDTLTETGKALSGIDGKTIVLTGSMSPARFRQSDAVFNVGCAITAAQTLPAGVYITMNGRIFNPNQVSKNVNDNRFE